MLKRFNIDSTKTINTPIHTFTKLDMDHDGESFDHNTYRDMIGSLLYLTITRSDIRYIYNYTSF